MTDAQLAEKLATEVSDFMAYFYDFVMEESRRVKLRDEWILQTLKERYEPQHPY